MRNLEITLLLIVLLVGCQKDSVLVHEEQKKEFTQEQHQINHRAAT